MADWFAIPGSRPRKEARVSFCRSCGNPLGEGERFCGNCGQPAGQAGAGIPPAVPQPPASGAYPPQSPYATGQPYGQSYGQTAYAPPQQHRGKGLWIGLSALLLAVVAVACVLVFVVFYDDIFKDDATASNPPQNVAGQTANLSVKSSPTAIMASSVTMIGASESLTGTFDLKVTITADSSLPADQAKMYAEPWTLKGTMAYTSADQAGDFKISLGMMGKTMDVGIRLLGGKAWIGLADQWYEASSNTEQQLAGSGVSGTLASLQKMLSTLAIDPTSWLKDQAPVKEEKIDGVKVLHISGSNPDWAVMLGDLAKITSSPEYQNLMSSAGSTASSLASQLPSSDQLTKSVTQMDALLKNVTVDLWVEKGTALLRKAAIVCDVTPPAGDTTSSDSSSGTGSLNLSGSGITSMSLAATITLDPNQPVNVEAPSSAKTYDQLQADIQANPALLGPLGELLSGLGSSQ